MATKVKPVPEGVHTITPHLVVPNADEAIAFYSKAFGAQELCRIPGPGGKVMHAELQIGDSRIMLCDEFPEMGNVSPLTLGGCPAVITLSIEDGDAVHAAATAAGASVVMPMMDAFWGDRYGQVKDPSGYTWALCTHVEDVSPEEIARRAAAQFSGGHEQAA